MDYSGLPCVKRLNSVHIEFRSKAMMIARISSV